MAGSDHEGDGGWPPNWDRFTPDRKYLRFISRAQEILAQPAPRATDETGN